VPYSILFRYGAAFLAGVALSLLWHSNVMRGVQIERLQQAAELVRVNDENQQRIANIDTAHTKELNDAKEFTATLAADLASSTKRLRIKATCPVLPAGDSASSSDAGTAELSESARQSYLYLRGLLEQKEYQIKVLQDALK
jgi:prophage endopeptidase